MSEVGQTRKYSLRTYVFPLFTQQRTLRNAVGISGSYHERAYASLPSLAIAVLRGEGRLTVLSARFDQSP